MNEFHRERQRNLNSSAQPGEPRRVAVVGGGISGLAAAHRLGELAPRAAVTLFEAGTRLGGVVQTERRDGFLIERSADMFTTKDPWALDLCRRIGFDPVLIETNKEHRRAFVVKRGKLVPVPPGFTLMAPVRFWPMVTTPLLSLRGKLRLAWEYFTPAKKDEADESLAQFATRRLGREAYDWLVQPLIGGIYTADPERLSMAATMRQFQHLERKYGGLLRGMRRTATSQADSEQSGARYNRFLAPRNGMGSLVDALAARLPAGCARLGAVVEAVTRDEDQTWNVTVAGGTGPERFDDVILACGAARAAQLIGKVHAGLSVDLLNIPHAGVAIVILAYRREQIAHKLDGFGFVVPIVEERRILAGSFASVKYPGRAPAGQVLLRIFVGGACQPELLELSNDELQDLVRKELSELLGATGEPVFSEVVRWQGAMPQYHVGHLALAERIERQAAGIPRFALAGNALHGVGVPFCIHSGEQAAERIVNHSTDTVT